MPRSQTITRPKTFQQGGQNVARNPSSFFLGLAGAVLTSAARLHCSGLTHIFFREKPYEYVNYHGKKEKAHRLIVKLPAKATRDDAIYVRKVIGCGLADSKAGRTRSVWEVRAKHGLPA
jgi:hypothetical protein